MNWLITGSGLGTVWAFIKDNKDDIKFYFTCALVVGVLIFLVNKGLKFWEARNKANKNTHDVDFVNSKEAMTGLKLKT